MTSLYPFIWHWFARAFVLLAVVIIATACEPAARQILPTERPSVTPTATATATRTPGTGREVTPTVTATRPPATATGGPSPTPLLGATSTPDSDVTPTRVPNPNAPRVEFFTTDVQAVTPGEVVTLFWSTRGADGATIYRLDPTGARNQLWNVPPDGSLTVNTRESDRGTVDFLLSVGEGIDRNEEPLSLPLTCPVTWFFAPPPEECPDNEPAEVTIVEQPFVRGRMLYLADRNRIYVLYNDETDPQWTTFTNRYNPAVDEPFLEGFPVPEGRVQPVEILGFVWRNSDITRSRLGLGTQQEFSFDGFVQTAPNPAAEDENLYISASDGTVLRLLPEGTSWEIITPEQ
ncbi:MAG: hypothetical protein AAF653_12330 [Chloroflexota bacterium]